MFLCLCLYSRREKGRAAIRSLNKKRLEEIRLQVCQVLYCESGWKAAELKTSLAWALGARWLCHLWLRFQIPNPDSAPTFTKDKVYHPFFPLLMNTGFSNFRISSFCKAELIFTVTEHSLNRQLLFSPGWCLFMNAVRKRGHSAPFWIVSGLGSTKHRNNSVTSISVKHKTHHKLLTGTSWLIFSLVRLLNVCLASVSSRITGRWCNYWHSIWLKLPRG